MPKCRPSPIGFPIGLFIPEVLIHEAAQDELREIFKSGNIPALRSAYKKRLEYLLEKRQKAAVTHKVWFEELPKTNGLFSMRFIKGNNLPNLRIIYYFMGDTPYLVVAFIERNKTDYCWAIELAQKRRIKTQEE